MTQARSPTPGRLGRADVHLGRPAGLFAAQTLPRPKQHGMTLTSEPTACVLRVMPSAGSIKHGTWGRTERTVLWSHPCVQVTAAAPSRWLDGRAACLLEDSHSCASTARGGVGGGGGGVGLWYDIQKC